MSKSSRRIGIFGGTFDPVHHGHIDSAKALVTDLSLDTLCFMPCQQHPNHKHPGASPEQRADMLALALANEPQLTVDDRELKRKGMSYTVDSLQDIRREYGGDAMIVFIMGSDAFSSFHRWERWQAVLSLANIAVIERAGEIKVQKIIEPALKALLNDATAAFNVPYGALMSLVLEPHPISSTLLRSQLVGDTDRRDIDRYIPASVISYIEQQQLYLSPIQ